MDNLDDFFDIFNTFSVNELAGKFFGELLNQHRTVQQNFWRVVFSTINKYAELKPYQYDDRNKGSHETCKKIADFMREKDLNYLPMI